ncbi:MAG: carbamoyl phosphate synthase small subunit, partial [Planctomycetaceae bacterium]|nr:carbamoyl phosphate synthase small subunit [Planctomycetaceae bacterium]
MPQPVKLALSDGTVFEGQAFGAQGEAFGEVVFNTSMTGYQEIITDPSYCGQIVVMTYPQIGNYGVNPNDLESKGTALKGFLCKELCEIPSNYRATHSLDHFLAEHGVIGMQGIDTRALVRKLRTTGVMTGVISTTDLDNESLIRKAQQAPNLEGIDYVQQVAPQKGSTWNERLDELARDSHAAQDSAAGGRR